METMLKKIERIQEALRSEGADGWLLYNFGIRTSLLKIYCPFRRISCVRAGIIILYHQKESRASLYTGSKNGISIRCREIKRFI